MQEGGHRVKAGQAVRMLDIRVQRQYGAWDCLHSHQSGNALSDALKRAAGHHYGHAGRAFLQRLTREQDEGFSDALEAIKAWPAFPGPKGGGRGVTGWDQGAATEAAGTLFTAWRDDRGNAGANLEQAQIRAAVLAFIEAHGASRFQDAENPEAVVHKRAGFRQHTTGGVRYLFTASGMKEALQGIDQRRAR